MSYIAIGDIAAFGLTGATQEQLDSASGLIDAYLNRPEGLVWVPGADGGPCYMAALTPERSFVLSSGIAPGHNVVVPIPTWLANPDLVGEVVVIDRATTAATEACVIVAATPTTATLQSVSFAHSAGAAMDLGLAILEERPLPAKRAVARISRTPCVRLLSVQGRYGYGRRSDQMAGNYDFTALAATMQLLGGPAAWLTIDATEISISNRSGEVWLPASLFGADYSDVRLRYIAGWTQSAVPAPVKQACAALVRGLMDMPEVSGNVRKFAAGGTSVERFADSLLDAESRARLSPYMAQVLY